MTRSEFRCDCGETFWRREGLDYHRANKLCGTNAVMAEIAQIEGQNAYVPSRPLPAESAPGHIVIYRNWLIDHGSPAVEFSATPEMALRILDHFPAATVMTTRR